MPGYSLAEISLALTDSAYKIRRSVALAEWQSLMA